MRLVAIIIMPVLMSACVEHVAKAVVTAPVKIVSATGSVIAPSHDKADRRRGREARKAEQRANTGE